MEPRLKARSEHVENCEQPAQFSLVPAMKTDPLRWAVSAMKAEGRSQQNFDDRTLLMAHNITPLATVVYANHGGGRAQLLGGRASSRDNSGVVEKRNFTHPTCIWLPPTAQFLSQNQTLHGYVVYNWSYGHFVILLPTLAKIWLPGQRHLHPCNQKCLRWIVDHENPLL